MISCQWIKWRNNNISSFFFCRRCSCKTGTFWNIKNFKKISVAEADQVIKIIQNKNWKIKMSPQQPKPIKHFKHSVNKWDHISLKPHMMSCSANKFLSDVSLWNISIHPLGSWGTQTSQVQRTANQKFSQTFRHELYSTRTQATRSIVCSSVAQYWKTVYTLQAV